MKKYDTALVYLQDALAGFKEVKDMNWVMRTLLESGKASKKSISRKKQLNIQENCCVMQRKPVR